MLQMTQWKMLLLVNLASVLEQYLATARVEFTTKSTGTTSMIALGLHLPTRKTPVITPREMPKIPSIESEKPATGSLKVA